MKAYFDITPVVRSARWAGVKEGICLGILIAIAARGFEFIIRGHL